MPEEAHRIMKALRTQRDEELLEIVRDTLAQLGKLADRLEGFVNEGDEVEDEAELEQVSPE